MKRATLVVASASAVILVASAVGAGASGVVRPQPVVQPAAVAHQQLAPSPLDTALTSTFTPVTACQVAATKTHGGPIPSGKARDFAIGGTVGFAPQGGRSGGCAIPTRVVAVAVTITSFSGKHTGYLKAYRPSAPEPGATFLMYGPSSISTVSGTSALDVNGRMRIKNVGAPTNVVIDVTGYYLAPMTADVGADGTLNHGSRTTGSQLLSPSVANYQVDFDRDVSGCTYSVSSYFPGYYLVVEPRTGVPNSVFVSSTFDHAPAADRFYLTVTC